MRIYVVRAYKFKAAFHFLKTAVALILVFVLAFYFSSFYFKSDAYVRAMHEATEKKTVIIDAGHGGEDPGVVGEDGVYEKDLNLTYAKIIGELLEKEGYAVVYTRTEDKLLYKEEENIKGIRKISDLKNRCLIAAEYPNAIFISIHMNSFSSSKYSGLQVYYAPGNDNARMLGDAIQSSVRERLQNENSRKIKSGEHIYVLEHITNPAVVVECGFLTNLEEAKKLSEKEYQKSLSFAIVCGIIEYTKTSSSY